MRWFSIALTEIASSRTAHYAVKYKISVTPPGPPIVSTYTYLRRGILFRRVSRPPLIYYNAFSGLRAYHAYLTFPGECKKVHIQSGYIKRYFFVVVLLCVQWYRERDRDRKSNGQKQWQHMFYGRAAGPVPSYQNWFLMVMQMQI